MALTKRNPGARLARRATRRTSLRHGDPRKRRRIWLWIIAALLVIVLALVWGNYLKAESDARRAAAEKDEWLLEADTAIPIPVAVPSVNAGYAAPSQKMQTSQDMSYDAVIFDLGSCLAPLPYSVELPSMSGLTVNSGAPTLVSDVTRFQNAGFYVVGVFTVTSFDTDDVSQQALRRGLEMTLLSLYAKAGVDDILLMGLPVGSDTTDQAVTDYLLEVESLWASIPVSTPALGVVLPPAAFVGDTLAEDGSFIYAGNLTPGRMLAACDYIVLDLRQAGAQVGDILQGMQYAYVRYNLRLLTSLTQPDTAKYALSHGFSRIFEYKQ